MHAPGLVWRGATSAPFPGYMLIGRGADFATTLTSASGDLIDQYAETLCDGSDTKYEYQGSCRSMGTFNAGVLKGSERSTRPNRSRSARRCMVRSSATPQSRGAGSPSPRSVRLRQGRARPAALPRPFDRRGQQPADVLRGREPITADLQLLLHRLQAHRRIHLRAAAAAAGVCRPRLAHRRPRQRRMDRLPLSERASRTTSTRPGDASSIGTTTSRKASAPRTTSGCGRVRSAVSTC